MMDFEKASMRTFSNTFTETNITGYFFHLCKSIYRKVLDIRCKVKYQTDQEFNTEVKCFCALAFVPVSDVIDAFEELCDDDALR